MRRTSCRDSALSLEALPLFFVVCTYVLVAWCYYVWNAGLGWAPHGANQFKAWALEPFVGSYSLVDCLTASNVAWVLLLSIHAFDALRGVDARRVLPSIACALALVAALQLSVSENARAAHVYDNDTIRSDEGMLDTFAVDGDRFDEFAARIRRHAAQAGASPNFWDVFPRDWRWFNTASRVHRALQRWDIEDDGRRIVFFTAQRGVGSRLLQQGYVQTTIPPKPLFESVEAGLPASGRFEGYRPVRGDWYLFLRRAR